LNGYLDKLLLGAALIFPIVLGPVRVLPLQEVMGFWGSLNLYGLPLDLIVKLFFLFTVQMIIIFSATRINEVIVIYNITTEQLVPVLHEILHRSEIAFQQTGNLVVLTNGIYFQINDCTPTKNITLTTTSQFRNATLWKHLETELINNLKEVKTSRHNKWLVTAIMSVICFFLSVPF
ncbi:MAG: hypothetical protein LBU65_08175, partial [Planctomycetaceae bacterium]|nr:hypothetical protein [Planctomycetaceae bacterium]